MSKCALLVVTALLLYRLWAHVFWVEVLAVVSSIATLFSSCSMFCESFTHFWMLKLACLPSYTMFAYTFSVVRANFWRFRLVVIVVVGVNLG